MKNLRSRRIRRSLARRILIRIRAAKSIQKQRRSTVRPQLHRPRTGRHRSKLFFDLKCIIDRVQQYLRTQSLAIVTREVVQIGNISIGRRRTQFENMRLHNRANQMFDIVAMFAKVTREVLKQCFVGCRIGRANVVDWFDQTFAHDLGPNTIGHHFGKVRIGRICHPFGQCFARIVVRAKLKR